jgi:hypothetical protein
MKLFVELSEQDVQVKVDELLGKRISEITDEYVKDKVQEVIDVKLSRINIGDIFNKAAERILIQLYGQPGAYNQSYGTILREEACKLLTERLQHKGLG